MTALRTPETGLKFESSSRTQSHTCTAIRSGHNAVSITEMSFIKANSVLNSDWQAKFKEAFYAFFCPISVFQGRFRYMGGLKCSVLSCEVQFL